MASRAVPNRYDGLGATASCDRLRAEGLRVLTPHEHSYEEVPIRQRDQILRLEVVAEFLAERAAGVNTEGWHIRSRCLGAWTRFDSQCDGPGESATPRVRRGLRSGMLVSVGSNRARSRDVTFDGS